MATIVVPFLFVKKLSELGHTIFRAQSFYLGINNQIMNKIILASIVSVGLLAFNFAAKKRSEQSAKSIKWEGNLEKRLANRVAAVKKAIAANSSYNAQLAFLIDMKIPSGKNRFFIYDLKADQIIDQGLVAHGSGSETGLDGQLQFSNENQSYCTALGTYSIGRSYCGKFGKAYKLHGLDTSNSNAYERCIVLHPFKTMPYDEQAAPICNSQGCPMVNRLYFERIEKIIDGSEKSVLLDIYY